MWVILIGFLIGAILGSFIEASSKRVSRHQSIKGRSYCLRCKHNLNWYDLFPVLSYLSLKGCCRYCKNPIPKDDLLVEVMMGILTALFLWHYLPDLGLLTNLNTSTILLFADILFKLAAVAVLVIIFLIDLRTGLIPDKITYPASIAALVYLLSIAGIKSFIFYQQLNSNIIGKYLLPPHSNYFYDQLIRLWTAVGFNIASAILSALIFILIIIVTKGKGMGWGDVKFVFFMGLILGFPNIIVAIFLAFLSGAIISLLLIAINKKHFGQTIPFGPFLSLGTFLALLYGNKIIDWYLKLRI